MKLILENKQLILKYSRQGFQGRTGPMGLPGEDAINWETTVIMEGDTASGNVTVSLFRDGVLDTDIHYAEVYVMGTLEDSYALSQYSRTISGEYSCSYTDLKAVFVVIWEDIDRQKLLTSGTATNIRGRDIRYLDLPAQSKTYAQWAAIAVPGTFYSWTTGEGYDNSGLENGDLVCIIGSVSDQLDGSGNPISAMVLGQASIPAGGDISASVTVISRALFMGQQGAKGDKGDPGSSESAVWGGISGDLEDQEDLQDALDGKLSTTGGTMTGSLVVQNGGYYVDMTDIDLTSNPASDKAYASIIWRDVSSTHAGSFRFLQTTAGKTGFGLFAHSGTALALLKVYIDANDNISYEIGDPEAFRNALGAVSGILPISLGGTGATAITDMEVLSNPSVFSGSIHAVYLGKLCVFKASTLKLASALTSDSVLLGTIAYRDLVPRREIYVAAGSKAGVGMIQITTSGKVYFYKPGTVSSWPTSANISFSAFCFLADAS